jgi:pimeloyl-ACP methyl ester carboxylesterase
MMVYSTLLKRLYRAIYGEPPALSDGREGLGLVLVADGVGGLDLCGTGLRYVMGAQRLPYLVKVVPWGHGLGRWHADLTRTGNRDAGASLIADEVRNFRAQHAELPVYLVGKSGGTGVIVKALEELPDGSVEGAILLAPAISPAYDLTQALRAVRHEMVVFWSPFDLIVLGAGTRIFGTIDRVKAYSAGLVGFRVPEPLSDDQRVQYAKLRQVRWRPKMASTGYLGGHVGPDSPAFLRKYVVPLLRMEQTAPG